jgi:alpha-glucosidase (family GH31 glycosyl hydrolase)
VRLVKLSRNGFYVQVQPKPLVIEIRKGRRPMLKRTSCEGDYQKEEEWLCFDDVEIASKGRDKTLLRCKGREVEMFLKLRLYDRLLEVTWEKTSGAVESTSDFWTSPRETHWYGQINMDAKFPYFSFPLESHVSKMMPSVFNTQMPLWLNETGAAILADTYELFAAHFENGLTIRGLDIETFSYHILLGEDIRDARSIFQRRVGLPERIPAEHVFIKPIFTTWVEYKQGVDQEKVVAFAKDIQAHDFPCGVVEIDDKWEGNYGDFTFDFSKFPDPKMMVESLHKMGYLVTLWVYPYFNLGSANYSYAKERNYLVLDPEKDEPAVIRWWNGEGGLLDVSKPEAMRWYNKKIQALKDLYGFDGFKFDAGDAEAFPLGITDGEFTRPFRIGRSMGNLKPNQYTDEWLAYIAKHQYNLAEVRVGYLAQRFGIIAREGDKDSRWGLDNGLHAIITHAFNLSINGHPYIMPDMIGGNQYDQPCERELFIRWAEAASLMPIVQYSITPWSYDEEVTAIARSYSLLHLTLGEHYIKLAKAAKENGEPIISPLILRYPHDKKCSTINDQFLIGDLLVAPVIKKNQEERDVYLPKGKWIDFWNEKELTGPKVVTAKAPLNRLPLYIASHNSELAATLKNAKKEIFNKTNPA